MTSLKSFFNTKLFWENLKQQKYLMILHTILLFIVSTLPALIIYNDAVQFDEALTVYRAKDIAELFSGNNPFMMVLLTAVGVVTSIFLYNYLYKHQSVQFYHSMPYKRECIYITKFLSGVVAMILPLILIYIVNSVLFNVYGIGAFVEFTIVIKGFLLVALLYISVFAVATFGASVSGNFFAQLIITAFVYLVYVVSTAIITLSYEVWFNNIAINFNYNAAYIFQPFVLIADKLQSGECLFIICYTLAFFVFGLVLFKLRKSESTGKFFAYNCITIFLKYYVAFFASLLIGALFIAIGNENMFISYFGYILAAFVAFIALQGVFGKSFKGMFANMKSFIIFAVIICLVVSVPITMKEYFRYNLPDAEYVNSVSVRLYNSGSAKTCTFNDTNNIKESIELFSINELAVENFDDKYYQNIHGTITINPDAKLFTISYIRNLIKNDDYYNWYSKVYDTKDYKDNIAQHFDIDFQNHPYVELRKTDSYVIQKEEEELFDKLKSVYIEDLNNSTYEDIKNSHVYALINLSHTDIKIYKCYENTVKFLEEGIINKILFNVDATSEIEISRYNYDTQTNDVVFKTSDRATINDIAEHAVNFGSSIQIKIIDADGREEISGLNIDNLPAYIKNAIANQ